VEYVCYQRSTEDNGGKLGVLSALNWTKFWTTSGSVNLIVEEPEIPAVLRIGRELRQAVGGDGLRLGTSAVTLAQARGTRQTWAKLPALQG